MAGEEPKGICPHCGGRGGPTGGPCGESVCQRQGYHFIPLEHAEKVHGMDGPGLTVDPQIGRMVDRYLIVGSIGQGGMGSVYLALQLPLEREVALKMVSGVTLDETAQGRFEREAKAISMLYHPNIVQLYEYGFNPLTGAPFMALEYVKGGRELMDEMISMNDRGLAWEPRRVEHVFGQVLSALQTAHSKGLVHRDIKPQNVMLVDIEGNADFVKILDFGLARTLAQVPGMDRLTGTGTVVGTPQYMAPEQLIGGGADVDRRSDLYSVGAVIFEIATGLTAYPGTDPRAVLALKLDSSYSPVERLPAEQVHGPMLDFLSRAIARDPEIRFSTASEMREALFGALSTSPPMGRIGLHAGETVRMATPQPIVDAEAATIASDGVPRPRTEQLSAFERPSVPSQETLETEIEVPGKVPGRMVLAGALTGAAILAAVLAFVFLVLPGLRSAPPPAETPQASLVDASAVDGGTSPEEQAIAAAMDASSVTAPPEQVEEEEAGKGKTKHKTRPVDAESGPAADPGTPVSADPGIDPGWDPGSPVANDPGYDPGYDPGTDPGQPGPGILDGPPMVLIHAKLKALTPAIRSCLPEPQGQVTVGVVIDSKTGKAGKVKVSGFFSGGQEVKSCIVDAIETLEVQPFKGSDVGVPYTYSFGPSGDAGISAEDLLKAAVVKKFDKAKGWLVACSGDKEGTAKVEVRVSGATGKVIEARVVDPPFAGTPEGECMEKALMKVVNFPTFDKDEALFTHTYKLP